MDHDEEIAKFKWLLFAGVAFLVSMYCSYQELKYAVWGASAEATVTETFTTSHTSRWAKRNSLLAVKYTFTDEEGKLHSERDDVPIDWELPEDTVKVQYLPGVEDSSRLEGHSNMFAVWIFLICTASLGFALYKLIKEANEAIYGRKFRR